MSDKGALHLVRYILTPQDFYSAARAEVYQAILGLREDNVPSDFVTVTDRLAREGTLEKVGGQKALADCMKILPKAQDVEHYANIVRRSALDRRIDKTLHALRSREEEGDNMKRLAELYWARESLRAYDIFDFRTDLNEALEHLVKNLDPGLQTGFPALDSYFYNLRPGTLTALCGYATEGKTTLATDLAAHVARTEPVLYVTTEMAKEELVLRILPGVAKVASIRINRKNLREEDWPKLQAAKEPLSRLSLMLWARERPRLSDIRGAVYRSGAKLVVVDLLQRIYHDKAESHNLAVHNTVRDLKTMSRELGVAIVLLCQLNRNSQKDGKPRRPDLSDIRDTGGVEQEADNVLLLWTPLEKDLEPPLPPPGTVGKELVIRKQRNGPAPRFVKLQLDSAHVTMEERVERTTPPSPTQEELGLPPTSLEDHH